MAVYKIKDKITEEELIAAGFLGAETEDNEKYFYCFVPQPLNGDLAQGSLNGIYGNKDWKEKFYDKHKDLLKEKLGLEYDKKGKPKMTEMFIKVLTHWRIEFNFEDKELYMKSLDPWDAVGYNDAGAIDKFCGQLIKELNDLKLIDRVEE